MRALIIGASMLLTCSACLAQTVDQKADNWPYGDLWESVDYLQAGHPNPYAIYTNQQFAGLMGREDLIPVELDFHLRQQSSACGPSTGPIFETIIGEAAKTQIVIFNEAHMMPLHRAGVFGIVDALVDAGFTHYAYESFEPSITDRSDAYIRAEDVFYSNDPMHARLLRRLKARGVELIAYEADRPEGREIAQALNLKERVFDQDPEAKLIVVSGWRHVIEYPQGLMAREVKDRTGHDPLTVSQTHCYASGDVPLLANSRLNKAGTEEAFTQTDYMIGHPQLTFTDNRPDWRRVMGDIDVSVPSAFTGHVEPVIIEARREGEPDEAVPEDRLLLLPGDTGIPLLLPPGRYRVKAFSRTTNIGEPVMLTVPEP